ncbi:MAG: DNA repair protein RecN [Pseudomonadota bacterium]|nr:DNA repair protein RecN [Pseudomonadota bacterium]
MLTSLSITNIVLIDQVDLEFTKGLCVLTGETGAGKSILLDALSLAIGERADTSVVRGGSTSGNKSTIYAAFELSDYETIHTWMMNNEIEVPRDGEPVILRRTLTADGRSRAFINDQPVSAGALRAIGGTLVEIEGQFASHGLLNPGNHRSALDAFGKLNAQAENVEKGWVRYKKAKKQLRNKRDEIERIAAEGDYLRHVYTELTQMDPQKGEEESLLRSRSLMMNAEKIADAIKQTLDMLTGSEGFQHQFSRSLRSLERVEEISGGLLKKALEALDRSANEAAITVDLLLEALQATNTEPEKLEQLDERLFGLRAAARKHNVDVDSLARLCHEFAKKIGYLDDADRDISRLEEEQERAKKAYSDLSLELHAARMAAAKELDRTINAEFPYLRLESALFCTRVTMLGESEWSQNGIDRVVFEATTNPGHPAGPINRVASGGELARLLLALKVALFNANGVTTLVFDEVDAGVGGATAAAIAERLATLSEGVQVLVVTHSPQVAARATQHFHVTKSVKTSKSGSDTVTVVSQLSPNERREEIARMLAGAKVTDEARAAADKLITEINN